jgi:uncharacterized GH25 family protein
MVSARLRSARAAASARVLLVVAVFFAATAHDFWVEPARFRFPLGDAVGLGFYVGDHFSGDPVGRDDARILAFKVVAPDGSERPAVGRPGDHPAGRYRPTVEGVHLAYYRSRDASVELSGPKFAAYLKEEGLDAIARRREELGIASNKAKELYSRCSKTLFKVGGGGGSAFDRRLGLPLEIVPTTDPYALKAPAKFEVRVTLDGRPLSGVATTALLKNEESAEVPKPAAASATARTNVDGLVSFALERPGVWMIKCVHMTEAAKTDDADYKSLWATLVFDLEKGERAESRPTAESRKTQGGSTER